MQNLSLAFIQTSLFWEDPEKNTAHFSQKIETLGEPADLIVLPEMFSTGFTMHPSRAAEPMEGATMRWMHETARRQHAVIAGSLVIEEGGSYYNRFVWMPPDGRYQCYDKKHLFSYAGENENYTSGSSRLVVELNGWKIMPQICYDLRFPVFSRNRWLPESGFDYDLLLYVANWPASRSHAWRVLLMARAIENMCYVAGVNRIGTDARDIAYSGDSAVIDPLGETLAGELPHADHVAVVSLPRCPLDSHRDRFRAWADWDGYYLKQ